MIDFDSAIRSHTAIQKAIEKAKSYKNQFTPESRKVRWELNNAYKKHIQVRRECSLALAKERGWLLTDKDFSVYILRMGSSRIYRAGWNVIWENYNHQIIDHKECFRARHRPYAPVALLSHSYSTDHKTHESFAQVHHLRVEFLNDSWYFPGNTVAALYTRG